MTLTDIKHILLVLSGKGGVGKSSITTQLALALCLKGFKVGVLDVDLTGPSIPRFLGIEDAKVRQAPGGWIPVPVHEARISEFDEERSDAAVGRNTTSISKTTNLGSLSCMSLGFMLASSSDAVIWRGPKKTAMIKQFLNDVHWGPLDYLLIDTPPGTSDEHISLVENLLTMAKPGQLAGAVVVTTPQAVSVADVKKELNFCQKTGVTVRGIVENMAGFVCPHCAECTNIFSKGGGQVMALDYNIPFLGGVPLDPLFVELIEQGTEPQYPPGTLPLDNTAPQTAHGDAFRYPHEDGTTHASLVQKYTKCSLCPLFMRMAEQLHEDISVK